MRRSEGQDETVGDSRAKKKSNEIRASMLTKSEFRSDCENDETHVMGQKRNQQHAYRSMGGREKVRDMLFIVDLANRQPKNER